MNVRLIAADDECLSWLMGAADAPAGLRAPPGGVDEPVVVSYVRNTAAKVRQTWQGGCWMVVVNGEVVGLCSYKTPPDRDGLVEIGYGIAPQRRRRGHATLAVGELILLSAKCAEIHCLTAETEVSNVVSQRVLARNDFRQVRRRSDPKHGEFIVWRRDLPRIPSQPLDTGKRRT